MRYRNTKTGVVVSVKDGIEVRGDWVAIDPAPVPAEEKPKKTTRKRTAKTK